LLSLSLLGFRYAVIWLAKSCDHMKQWPHKTHLHLEISTDACPAAEIKICPINLFTMLYIPHIMMRSELENKWLEKKNSSQNTLWWRGLFSYY
jgi:hypothetical protein